MSGGVDSSLTAALLKQQGHDVFGITLKLAGTSEERQEQIIESARSVADHIGIEHHVLDARGDFGEQVIDYFVQSYVRGQTPNPCARCNRFIKFGRLADRARELGAEFMATGHYAKITRSQDGLPELYRSGDEIKDQSYFLFALSLDQLAFLRFPLGGMSKPEVRQIAAELKLTAAQKPESQDICFVPEGDYASVVKQHAPGAFKPGKIVHQDGRVLGQHKGIIHYTIGQRKGLGIGGGYTENNQPLFVVKIDAENNRVIVSEREALACGKLQLRDCNWLVPDAGNQVSVKFRSVMRPVPAKLSLKDNSEAKIIFDDPQYGVSPGQAAVCYDGDRVLGGGWIT
jgi:tRNA-specific 2-thiouridylase